MRTVGLVVLGMVWIGLALGAEGQEGGKVEVKAGFEHVDVEALRKAFIETFKADFDIVGDRLAMRDGNKEPYWLVTLRPKKAGFFIIRYDWKMKLTEPHRPGHVERGSYEHRLTIAEKGADRAISLFGPTYWATRPLACVDDDIVIPILVVAGFSELQFSTKSFDEESARRTQELDARDVDLVRDYGDTEYKLTVPDDLKENLELVRAIGRSIRSREGSRLSVNQRAVFRAMRPGRFGLSFSVKEEENTDHTRVDMLLPKDKEKRIVPMIVPIVIVSRDSRVTVLATGAYIRAYRGGRFRDRRERHLYEYPMIRVGEQFVVKTWRCGFRVDEKNLDKVEFPGIRAEKLPYKAKPGSFDEEDAEGKKE